MSFDFDIAVIGGGPSGSSAAHRMATLGHSVVLFEKKSMPRKKLCGGALSEQAIGYLDFQMPAELVDWDCYGARVHYKGKTLEGRLDDRIAVLVTRSKFDKFLVEKAEEAGTHVAWEQVTDVLNVDTGVIVKLKNGGSYKVRKCIIAAGSTSKLLEKVRPRDTADEEGFCVEAEIPTMSPDPFKDLTGLIDIYFGGAEFGYGWVFHHGSYYSIGVGGLRSKFSNPMPAMKKFCEDLGIENYEDSVQGHSIPRGGLDRKISSENLFLVGDAAGFVDPFYGEGLAYAIRSGQIAGDVLGKTLAGELLNPHSEYKKQTKIEFDENLKYSLIFSKLMYSIPRIFLPSMVLDSNILNNYLKVPLNKITYKKYIYWLLPRIPLFWLKRLFVK